MYRTPFRDDQQLVRELSTLVAVDRGNGSLVGVIQRGSRGPLIGFACPAATARPSDRAYDEAQRRVDEISISIPIQRPRAWRIYGLCIWEYVRCKMTG